MEKTRKTLETKLEKLRSDERKDDVITFEQLGVDRLFVDDASTISITACCSKNSGELVSMTSVC